eukprot:CAMPEP_0168535896 /NCGR_PEP_ID=MMETSP0405-20121227/19114_1 /TAXON_ID=498012 /ORGANISM="Trichosphaerium sp, Strain Am-I-7 wt" /LENGTH=94 /DNA_ID=CAMNT_0008563573 /DNA_START=15 /DNA_END=296 /DNA_ORIENTATION=+
MSMHDIQRLQSERSRRMANWKEAGEYQESTWVSNASSSPPPYQPAPISSQGLISPFNAPQRGLQMKNIQNETLVLKLAKDEVFNELLMHSKYNF